MKWPRLFRRKTKYQTPQRVELLRIGDDIFLNGRKILFVVDYNNPPLANPGHSHTDWLIGWAKIGMIKSGYNVPHFHAKHIAEFKHGA